MDSLWQLGADPIPGDAFPVGGARIDTVIAGAGIAGLSLGVMLARAGRGVLVVEAREVGAVTTGHTTAKITRLQGTTFQRIRDRATAAALAGYERGQREGMEWLLSFAEDHDVPVERRAAYTYAATPAGRASVEREFRLARDLGLPVELVRETGLPFPTFGAVRLDDQAQTDPMPLLGALVARLRAAGGRVSTGVRVTGASVSTDAVRVTTTAGEIEAAHLVLATGAPVLNRGLVFARLHAGRSYAQAWRVDGGALPDGMYLSADGPTRSIRTADDLLLTGGNGHGVGRRESPRAAADELADWTRTHWPAARQVAEWSAQDYSTPHGTPAVGRLPRGGGRIWYTTGFAKWGMTNGVATALILAGQLLGRAQDWHRAFPRRISRPAAVGALLGENAAIAAWYARGWVRALTRPAPDSVREGTGMVGRDGFVPTAVSRVDGVVSRTCAVCPHLGAVVGWNDAEKTWDCPAHGSRFAPDGAVLEGPARHPQRRRPQRQSAERSGNPLS